MTNSKSYVNDTLSTTLSDLWCHFNRHADLLYIWWQWRNFFISYLCQLFSAILWGQALRNVFIGTSFSKQDSGNTDIFLNQLIQFYSNNATNLHQLTTHSTMMLPHKMATVLRPQIC